MTNEGQYSFEVREDGKRIDGRACDDPFVTTHIGFHLSRWDAFKAIFSPLVKQFDVRVSGTAAACSVVFKSVYMDSNSYGVGELRTALAPETDVAPR